MYVHQVLRLHISCYYLTIWFTGNSFQINTSLIRFCVNLSRMADNICSGHSSPSWPIPRLILPVQCTFILSFSKNKILLSDMVTGWKPLISIRILSSVSIILGSFYEVKCSFVICIPCFPKLLKFFWKNVTFLMSVKHVY